jgi:CBS domain-containing protein
MLTDRDIVIDVVARSIDPDGTPVSSLVDSFEVVTIGADDSIQEALETMKRAKVRRLPVIDGHDLVGMVSQADLAVNLPPEKVGELLADVSAAP